MLSLFPQLFAFEQLAPFLLRLVLGIIFIVHGYPKLFTQFSETVQFFDSYGIRPAKVWVFLVGVGEFFGGILLILGLLTQAVALLIVIRTLIAIWKVKFSQGFLDGYEFDVAIIAMALSLLVLGPGAFAFDLPF
jgi:putative oxidoreductase